MTSIMDRGSTAAMRRRIVLALGDRTACGGDDERQPAAQRPSRPIKVGGIFDLSGATADVGTPYADGIKGFVECWNANGATGRTIELSSEDYEYDVAVAEQPLLAA